MNDRIERLISWNRWANLTVLGPLQVSCGEPAKDLSAFQHVLETELVWLRWMDGDRDAWFDPWQEPSLNSCREWISETDDRLARLGDGLDSRTETIFEYQTPWAGLQTAAVGDALLHLLMHSSQYRGEAAGFLNAAGTTVSDIDFMRWLTAPDRG